MNKSSCTQILLVEDDLDLRENISDVLQMEGYRVTEAENGRVALDILTALAPDEHPSCIILDLMMPVMDGQVFLETLQRDYSDNLAKIPILIATAKGSYRDLQKELSGKFDFIRKPMEVNDLLAAVEKQCGKQQA